MKFGVVVVVELVLCLPVALPAPAKELVELSCEWNSAKVLLINTPAQELNHGLPGKHGVKANNGLVYYVCYRGKQSFGFVAGKVESDGTTLTLANVNGPEAHWGRLTRALIRHTLINAGKAYPAIDTNASGVKESAASKGEQTLQPLKTLVIHDNSDFKKLFVGMGLTAGSVEFGVNWVKDYRPMLRHVKAGKDDAEFDKQIGEERKPDHDYYALQATKAEEGDGKPARFGYIEYATWYLNTYRKVGGKKTMRHPNLFLVSARFGHKTLHEHEWEQLAFELADKLADESEELDPAGIARIEGVAFAKYPPEYAAAGDKIIGILKEAGYQLHDEEMFTYYLFPGLEQPALKPLLAAKEVHELGRITTV